MKILAFVDIHADMNIAKEIVKKSKDVDILVGAGDFSIFETDLTKILKELNKAKKPVLVIPGNHETNRVLINACSLFENIRYLHKQKFEFQDVIFLGFGGGGFSLVDPEFEKFSKKFRLKTKDTVVLITHAPPFGTKVDKLSREHHGNKSISNFIKKVDINLAICGHLHENAGKEDKIGKTKIINPGPKGMIVEV